MVTADYNRIPYEIAPGAIMLPAGGAVVDSFVMDTKCEAPSMRLEGRILACDRDAEPIRFIIRLPEKWNRRLLQYGGGGFDGYLKPMDRGDNVKSHWLGRPHPVAQGYVTCGCDSGHDVMDETVGAAGTGAWGSSWALNDEQLRNFAHEAIKKLHDVTTHIVQEVYGSEPEHSYFSGQSNGGRQAFLAAQRYPDDFDGIVCSFPALNWTMMALAQNRHADVEESAGAAGWIDAETCRRVRDAILEVCGTDEDRRCGFVHGPRKALGHEDALRARLESFLSPEQMMVIDAFAHDYDAGFASDPFMPVMPGFTPFSTVMLRNDDNLVPLDALSSAPGARDGEMELFAASVISCQIMRDPELDTRWFDPERHIREIRQAHELFNATNPNLDRFVERGGKIVLEHGLADNVIPYRATARYVESLRQRYGRAGTDAFLRFYLVPGYGHSVGSFDSGGDYLGALDEWVTFGNEPGPIEVFDRREGRNVPSQVVEPV